MTWQIPLLDESSDEMDKKADSKYLYSNISFLIMVIFATFTFTLRIYSALQLIVGKGVLNNIQYSILEIKLNETLGTYNTVYSIVNYPLITICGGILFNIYAIIKNYLLNKQSNKF